MEIDKKTEFLKNEHGTYKIELNEASNDVCRSYYAIIPADVRYDSSLSANAKLLYGEITALTNEKGYCWAGNIYFAKLYKVHKSTITKWVKQLRDNGYITYTVEKGPYNNHIRLIRIAKNAYTPSQKRLEGIAKKSDNNNTVYNNTNNKSDGIYNACKEYYNKRLLGEGISQTDISKYIFGSKKERQQLSNLIKSFTSIEHFKEYIDEAFDNAFIKSNGYVPSLLFSQKSKIMLSKNVRKPPADNLPWFEEKDNENL